MALAFLVLLILVAALAPWIAPYDPNQQRLDRLLQPPSSSHWLGTDDTGRDILSRIIFGARLSLFGSCCAGLVALVVGLPIGLIAGTLGGWVDAVLMRVVDAMLSFPAIILALAVVGALGPGIVQAMAAIGLVYSPRLARLLRAQARSVSTKDYVEAARLNGTSEITIMIRHVLPNSMRPVVVQWFLMLSFAFLAEAGLSFLGLGIQPPDPSWGHMLSRAYRVMSTAGWQIVAPAAAIALTVLSLNQVGDAVSRWFNKGVTD
ncbi:ABC transporter permease [Streptomyces sp. NPDC056390]|uniref:ABC transporter permease n=1 Tax=Streptomyces sp. NPDC056390 TaxID=3345806 RepID=UPI0035DD8BE4